MRDFIIAFIPSLCSALGVGLMAAVNRRKSDANAMKVMQTDIEDLKRGQAVMQGLLAEVLNLCATAFAEAREKGHRNGKTTDAMSHLQKTMMESVLKNN